MSLETRGYIPPEEDQNLKEEQNLKIKEGAEKLALMIKETLKERPNLDIEIKDKEKGKKLNLKKAESVPASLNSQFLDSEEGTDEETGMFLNKIKQTKKQEDIKKSLKSETIQKIEEIREKNKGKLTDKNLPKYYVEKAKIVIDKTKPEIDDFYKNQKSA